MFGFPGFWWFNAHRACISIEILSPKVSFFVQCTNQLITLQNFNIETSFSQFLWFFSLKCGFKGETISRIHLILFNAYKLMCFDRNINGNSHVKFFEWDYWSLHWMKKLTLEIRRNINYVWQLVGLPVNYVSLIKLVLQL